jgi:hypothetical protein
MQKITMSNYAGGIQEASGPNDFTERQWSQLKGFIPESDAVFESQWAGQRIGTDGGFQFVVPLPSSAGVFLVGVKAPGQSDAGTVWWAKAPASTAGYTVANAVSWTQITQAENRGFSSSSTSPFTQPTIPVRPNANLRFISYVPFEVYKYVKAPTLNNGNNFFKDAVEATTPKSIVSGALFHSRRPKTSQGYATVLNEQAVVAYVDIDANEGAGAVKVATFPNWRRLQQSREILDESENVVTAEGTFFAANEAGTGKPLADRYPYLSTDDSKLPRPGVDHHPHAVRNEDGAVLPGRGVIPRGNVGTFWGGLLVLGNVEHRQDQARIPTSEIADSTTLYALSDGNTAPHRSSFYFSLDGLDVFDPRAVLRAGSTDATILGMHVLGDALICVTAAGSEGDGVIRFDGDPTGLINYASEPNPFAIEREVVKGGIGGVLRDDTEIGHRAFSTLWSEANAVAFVDSLGNVWATNGKRCERLDMFGPLPPQSGSVNDHAASVGKHLFVWRDGRLLVNTIIDYYDGQGTACWTEMIPPSSDIRSMYGVGEELYFVSQGQVWRFSKAAPRAERGRLNNVPVELSVSTRTLGEPDEQSRKHWHRFGVTFETIGGGTLKSLTTRSSSFRGAGSASASYTVAVNNTVQDGEGRSIVPAGVGSQTLVSGTAVFEGDVRLQEFSFWFSGGVPAR